MCAVTLGLTIARTTQINKRLLTYWFTDSYMEQKYKGDMPQFMKKREEEYVSGNPA